MFDFTLHELVCLDAVVTGGSFQSAAKMLHRSHPSIHAAIKNLEAQLGIRLLDRSGYRVALTEEGRTFHARARGLLADARSLHTLADCLAQGEESELHVVVASLCPLDRIVKLLRRFSDDFPHTQLHLHFDSLSGPLERLFDQDADLIFHDHDRSDPHLDSIELFGVELIPVVAPGFLPFPITDGLTPEDMRNHVQCVIRDSARRLPPQDYFVVDGARRWTVGDQWMKKELILRGMGWGHMPRFMIEQELKDGRLLSIAGRYLKRFRREIVAARLHHVPRGPVAKRLWEYIETEARRSSP
ncbi:transcriptional regulator [Cystobacter fuscus]|uniref:Transcriptional regulator n=1 Tax=Cystobacter fuscus TaxID=43 RepID=A0A250JCL8_9BACT|nr:LysR family transcriptional regulator [Cystobacter fuscus]ATB41353.1 transcriptional regulator [Cystobacter fuscus]